MLKLTLFRCAVLMLILVGAALIFYNIEGNAKMFKPVNPEGANIPGISQAMIVEEGKLMFLSGHVPLTAEGKVGGDTLEKQLDLVFENMLKTLKAANTDFSSLVRVTLYIRDYDISKLETIRKVRDKWLNMDKPPSSALIGVQALFHPEVQVEVDAIAVVR